MFEERAIRVVKHFEHSRVKNYAGSVYVLKTDCTTVDESVRACELELFSIEAMHDLASA